MVATPELLQIGFDFACSNQGPDEFRWELIENFAFEYPRLLPPDKRVSGWYDGQPHKELVVAFEIVDTPLIPDHFSSELYTALQQVQNLIAEDSQMSNAAAKDRLKKMIAAHPDFDIAYHYLGDVYRSLEQDAEADAIVEEGLARFPDHPILRLDKAQMLLEADEIEAAEGLIAPVPARSELPYPLFAQLAVASIDIALKKSELDDAKTWLSFWEEIDPNNPLLSAINQKLFETSRASEVLDNWEAKLVGTQFEGLDPNQTLEQAELMELLSIVLKETEEDGED